MRSLASVLLSVLALSSLASAESPCALGAQDAVARPVRLRAKAVEVVPPFPTQRTDLAMFHAMDGEVRLGDARFAVEAKGRGLRVATHSGGEPAKAVGPGGVVALAVDDDDGGRRPVRILFERVNASDGGWRYAVVDGREFEIAKTTVQLLDADADGRFVLDGGDAYRFPPGRFLFPLGSEIVIARDRLVLERLASDGREINGRLEPLPGASDQLDALVRINELRASVGLPPTIVDLEISEGCSAHAKYLETCRWKPAKFSPHGEVREWKGFSEAGHRAAMASVIAFGRHPEAIEGHWRTYFHRTALVYPNSRGLGVSSGTGYASVIDGRTGILRDAGAREGWRDPILVPADGSVGVPKGFHRGGEIPSPVENAGICGFPLMAFFLDDRTRVRDFRGELVRIGRRGEEAPVPVVTPTSFGSAGRIGVIPEWPLVGGTYRVTFTFDRGGGPETVTATFETE